LRTVLVPLDGTPVAEHALPYALTLARRAGAEVVIAHVYSAAQAANEPGLLGWHDGDYLAEPARDYLMTLARRLADEAPVRVRPLLLRGRWPEDELCEAADRQADLVVMAARRRGWWSRLWSGSVSTGVVRNSGTPVLLVPGRAETQNPTAEPRLGRVLVPLDGSDRAERALGPAAALAALSNGRCELLHVARPRPYAVGWSLAYGSPPPVRAEPAWNAPRYLRELAGRLEAASVPARYHAVSDERPIAEAIARWAELTAADVVAMTSRGRGSLSHLLRGSVAEAVARRSPLPVLICRAP
jgi:nucleotide-binding universal stress UspA family protein